MRGQDVIQRLYYLCEDEAYTLVIPNSWNRAWSSIWMKKAPDTPGCISCEVCLYWGIRFAESSYEREREIKKMNHAQKLALTKHHSRCWIQVYFSAVQYGCSWIQRSFLALKQPYRAWLRHLEQEIRRQTTTEPERLARVICHLSVRCHKSDPWTSKHNGVSTEHFARASES